MLLSAQWNIGAVHPRGMEDAGVYMMKSLDGIAFEPMFGNHSLSWSDTKNVMFWEPGLEKYVAFIRIDNYLPDPHMNDTCTLGLRPARRVGRCIIGADQLHDWSLAGCTSHADGGGMGDTECSRDRSCASWGANCNYPQHFPLRMSLFNSLDLRQTHIEFVGLFRQCYPMQPVGP